MTKYISTALETESGDLLIFSDLEDRGDMWTGSGDRSRTARVNFTKLFRETPLVNIAIKMMDAETGTNLRYDLILEDVSTTGFDVRLKTWQDTKIIRASINWTAIGAGFEDGDWDDIEP